MDQCCINVRKIRKAQHMSLREMADKTGLSVSYLSSFENDKVNITINALRSIAKALDVSVKMLLTNEEDAACLIVPKEMRYSMVKENEKGESAMTQDFLTRGANFDMQVTVIHMNPLQNSGVPGCHDGQEFVYIMDGELTLRIDGRPDYILMPGDMAYYDAHVPHSWYNHTDKQITFIAVANRRGF